jgi:hypothetical protein
VTAPRVHLTLPPLDPVQTVYVLEQLIAALWRVHGTRLADIAVRVGLDTPRPCGARWAGRLPRPGEPDPDF